MQSRSVGQRTRRPKWAASTRITSAAEPLLERVDQEIETFYSDAAYATWDVREVFVEESSQQTIPPRINAIIEQHDNSKNYRLERDE